MFFLDCSDVLECQMNLITASSRIDFYNIVMNLSIKLEIRSVERGICPIATPQLMNELFL